MPDSSIDAFWCRPLDALFGQTESRPAGLTAAAAAERLARVGPNAVAQAPRLRLARKVARRFAEPLVAILLVAAAISGFTGDTASFAIIVTVIVLSIVLDIVQEQRAELIRDLKYDLDVNDAGIGVILNLVDQVHGLRRTLGELLEDRRKRGGESE